MLPTAQVFPFPVAETWPKRIAGRAMDTYHRWMEVMLPASMAGTPVLTVPAGFGPIGPADRPADHGAAPRRSRGAADRTRLRAGAVVHAPVGPFRLRGSGLQVTTAGSCPLAPRERRHDRPDHHADPRRRRQQLRGARRYARRLSEEDSLKVRRSSSSFSPTTSATRQWSRTRLPSSARRAEARANPLRPREPAPARRGGGRRRRAARSGAPRA